MESCSAEFRTISNYLYRDKPFLCRGGGGGRDGVRLRRIGVSRSNRTLVMRGILLERNIGRAEYYGQEMICNDMPTW